MAKKKLDADIPTFDSDLDFDFNTDMTGQLNQEALHSKKRGVIMDVATGVASGIKDTAKSPGFIRDTLKKSLPKNYGEITEGLGEATTGLYELYDQTQKEVKPRIGRLANKLDSVVPEGQKTLKKLTNKVIDWSGERERDETSSAGTQEDQAVATALGAIFTQQKQYTQIADRKQIVRDAIDKKRNDRSEGWLQSIDKNTSIQAQYTTNVTQAYQKKMLELQLRGYLAQKQHFANTDRYFQIYKAQNEAILKNTAMPEFLKITNSERFMDISKNRFFNSLYGEGSMIKKGMDRLKQTASEMTSGVTMALDNADMMADSAISGKQTIDDMNEMMAEMGLPPLTKKQMMGSMLGGNVLEFIRNKIAVPLRKKAEGNTKLTEGLAKGARWAKNPAGAIDTLRRSDKFRDRLDNYDSPMGTLTRGLDFLLDHFTDEGTSKTFKAGGKLDELGHPTMGFDKRAHVALVDIIPGYLSAIQREITIFRTGNTKTPLSVYDYQRNEFVTRGGLIKTMENQLADEVRTSASSLKLSQAAKKFSGDIKLDETNSEDLKKFLYSLSRTDNMDLTAENIRNTGAYERLPSAVKSLVDAKLDEIEQSKNKEERTTELSSDIRDIRKSLPSLEKTMDSYIGAGQGDMLAELGLIKKNDSGDYERDEEALNEFLMKHGIASSDINVKESIKEMNPKELLKSVRDRFKGALGGANRSKDFMGPMQPSLMDRAKQKWNPKAAFDGIKKTKLYDWFYKKGEGDEGQHFGPMAQELNKNLGEEAAPTGKKVDLVSMNGANMAAIKHLGGEIEKLSKGGKEAGALFKIQQDTDKIVKLLSGRTGGTGPKRPLHGKNRRATAAPGAAPGAASDEGQGYDDLLGNTIHSITDLGIKIGSDVFGAAGKMFSFGKDKVAKPAWDYIQKSAKDKDHPITKGFTTLFEKASKFSGSILEFGENLISKHIPVGFKQIKDFGGKVYEELSKRLNIAKDLYLPGGKEPVIRAIKLKSGFYRDSETGEPIFTMDKLLASKNSIVDAAGNVVLSAEERAQGLIDSHGEKVKTTAMNLVSGAIGAAFYAGDKAMQGLNYLKENGLKTFGKVKDWGKKKMDDFEGFGGGFGGSKYLKEGYQVWVDIRDILLGDIQKVKDRLKMKGAASFFDGASSGGMPTIVGADGEPLGPSGADTAASSSPDSGGGGPSGPGFFGSMVQRGKDALARRKEKQAEAMVGPQQPKLGWRERISGSKLGGRARDAWNGAGDRLKRMRDGGFGGAWGKVSGSKAGQLFGKGVGRLKGFGKGLWGGAASLAGSLFSGSGDQGGEAGTQTADTDPNRAKALAEGEESEVKPNKKKGIIPFLKRAWNDKDGDGTVDGSVEERRAKQEELAASRKKKGAEADLSLRYKNGGGAGGGLLDKLMTGIPALFSLMSTGLGKLFGFAGTMLSKLPGVGKLFLKTANVGSKIFGAVAKTGLKGLGHVAKFGLKTAGRVALFGLTKAVPAVLGGALSVAGAAIGAIASVLSSPIVIGTAAAAAVGYGLYKTYKYATRNNANDYERVRLQQYGFATSDEMDSYNHRAYMLEAYLLDGRVGYNDGKAYTIDKNVKPEDLAEIFKIDKDDTETAQNFSRWYTSRFKPFFLTHLSALYAADPKAELNGVMKLKAPQRLKYLEGIGFDSGPYDEGTSPIKGIDELDTNKDRVKEAIAILIANAQKEVKEDDKKSKLPDKKPDVNKETKQGDYVASGLEKAKKEQDEAKARVNSLGAGTTALETLAGEDGPRPNVPAALEKSVAAPGGIPLAPGAPMAGHGGLQFLKLGKGVNINNLQPGTLKMLLGMAEEYGKLTGKSIQVNDGFRSYEEQARLHQQNPEKAAKPGKSLHEFGLAVDVDSADANALEELGLMKKYGFTRPVGGEAWHMEPAGIQRNLDLARRDEGQRNIMVESSFFRGGGGYGTMADATRFKRNNELAMSLLDLPGKPAKETIAASMPDGKSASMSAGQGMPAAANDASGAKPKLTLVKGTEEDSTSKKLPSPQSVDAKTTSTAQASPNGEGESNKSGVTVEKADKASSSGDIKDIITKTALRAGGDPNMIMAFAAMESGLNPNAKANGTSASGLYGFLNGTWDEQLGKNGSKYGLPRNASVFDPEASTLMAAEYIKTNERSIRNVKADVNTTDNYLAWLLGAGGARKFLQADPEELAAKILPEAAAKNKATFYDKSGKPYTVKEMYDNISKKLSTRAQEFGIKGSIAEFKPSKAATEESPKASSPFATAGKGIDPAPTGTSPNAASDTSTKPEMILAGKNSGVYVDPRGNSAAARERRAAGESMAGPAMDTIAEKLDKSVGIQQDQLSVLRDILGAIQPEKIAEVLAAAMAASGKAAANSAESAKEQDRRNMGRSKPVPPSSVDFSRKAI